jgi:hypothetical protein
MFSPLNDPQVDEWFRQFDAASRHLPAEERASQREEMQQHLEGLVAAKVAQGQPNGAAWEAALAQFGNPAQIGRKINREWQQSRTGFRADIKAIVFGMGLTWLQSFAIPLWGAAWLLWMHFHGTGSFNGHAPQLPVLAYWIVDIGGTLLICAAIGRKYPLQAIKGAFYGYLLWILLFWAQVPVFLIYAHGHLYEPLPVMLGRAVLMMPLWMVGHVAVAYLASVTKRGWYRLSWSDFRLTPPRRRLRLSR